MQKRKSIPTAVFLNEIIEYDPNTGSLHWKRRGEVFLSVSKSDASVVSAWNSKYAGTRMTNKVGLGYGCVTILGVKYMAHRIIWKMVHGEEPENIDHIDGDRLNNRLSNLRAVSATENQRNRKVNANSASGVTGVRWCAAKRKWISQIKIDGKDKFLGLFNSLEEAAAARKKADRLNGYHENHGRLAAPIPQQIEP